MWISSRSPVALHASPRAAGRTARSHAHQGRTPSAAAQWAGSACGCWRPSWPRTPLRYSTAWASPSNATCIDVGCGGGEVTAMFAARATHGRVIGTDADEVKVELARAEAAANVELVVEDAATTVERGPFADVVYARFLLSHLGDGRRWVQALSGLLAPGGVLILEDTHIAGAWCAPPSAAFERAVDIYSCTGAGQRRRSGHRPAAPAAPRRSRARRRRCPHRPAGCAGRRPQADPAPDARRRCDTRQWPPGRPTMPRSTTSSPSSTSSSGGPTPSSPRPRSSRPGAGDRC